MVCFIFKEISEHHRKILSRAEPPSWSSVKKYWYHLFLTQISVCFSLQKFLRPAGKSWAELSRLLDHLFPLSLVKPVRLQVQVPVKGSPLLSRTILWEVKYRKSKTNLLKEHQKRIKKIVGPQICSKHPDPEQFCGSGRLLSGSGSGSDIEVRIRIPNKKIE